MLADSDHGDDVYASDDYEPESPTRSQQFPTRSEHVDSPSAVAQQQQLMFGFDSDAQEDDYTNAGAVTPLPRAKSGSKHSRTSREADTTNGRHLMDNTPWTYIVSAFQVRMLRIPVAESAAVRELRVFATIDKQAAQSRGSRWKQELRAAETSPPLRSATKKRRNRKGPGRVEPYRRSGLIEDAKWVRGDGRLQWTFPMEKFRRLKAYAPRIKAFVYGIREAGAKNRSRTQMENIARQEKDGVIFSFGWFFLDMRTPDLPERWIKLQNSPFGGEILISSTFLPVEISPARSSRTLAMQLEDRVMANGRAETTTGTTTKARSMPTVISGESGEYLQIGDNNGAEVFVLSVFIQTALNLEKVVETSMGENHEELQRTGFWLSYSLFDVVVQTDVFYNLSVAEFSAIRDSFRVKTNLKDLALCIEALGSLTVFMCTENRVLAGVEVPLRPLLAEELFFGVTRKEHEPKLNDTAGTEGEFSFPDFDNAIITASVAIELVESGTPQTGSTERNKPAHQAKQGSDSEGKGRNTTEEATHVDFLAVNNEAPTRDQVLFKVNNLRLKTSTLAPFAGEESISIEVTVGEDQVSGVLTFCAFTKHQAFALSSATGVVLENISCQTAHNTPIHIRCFSTASNCLVAVSSEPTKVIQDDGKYPKSIELSMLNESNQSVGQCTLTCIRGPTAHQHLGRELLSEAGGEMHRYRICLRLKSVRDIEISGGYCLRYQNPFLRSASIRSDWFTVQSKRETDTSEFYCLLDLTKDPSQLKQEMQESINIDLISSDEERVGSAIFSLSYLFFSEERFCCAEDTCEEMFITQADTEAHWLEVHTESALPDTQAGPGAYSHSYRSCSINIPIVTADSQTKQQRVGSIRVSAYLEDVGLLTDKHVAAKGTMIIVPPVPLLKKEIKTQEEITDSRSIDAILENAVRERSNSTSAVRDAEETASATRASSVVHVSAEHSHPGDDEERIGRERERQKEVAQFKEDLERERSAWRQEQHLQQLQWKRRFAEMEKARMDELEEEWAHREEERSNLLRSAQEEYQRLEQTLRESLSDLETRERRLAVAEATLQRERDVKRNENESLQRHLKSEQSHTLSLARKQTEAYERRIALLETQLGDSERRAKQVESDFAEYRQQQRKLPESRLQEEIAALKGNVAELEKQKMAKERECEISETNVDKMKSQLEQMSSLLMQEKKKHEARVVDELEKLRVKYIAREEKYVLDGDRDELRAIKKQLDDLKGFKLRGDGGKRNSRRYQRSHDPASPQHLRNNWHTQSRQTAPSRYTVPTSRNYHQGSNSYSDRASGDESDLEASSFIETSLVTPASRLNPIVPPSEREFSSPEPPRNDLQESHFTIPSNDGGEDELGGSTYSYVGSHDTELGRLLRERKLLLASGAYDAHSYLVRELDRLISVMKVNAEHQSSIA